MSDNSDTATGTEARAKQGQEAQTMTKTSKADRRFARLERNVAEIRKTMPFPTVTRPAAEQPNNRFIGACISIDRKLEALQAARANHFGTHADKARTDAEADTACLIESLLGQALALAAKVAK